MRTNARPGSITTMNAMTMKNEDLAEHAMALVKKVIDMMRASDDLPTSPLRSFHSAPERRELRRHAARLRKGQVAPRYKNLFTGPAQLADILERAARRDEMLEAARGEFYRTATELRRIARLNDPAVQEAYAALCAEMWQAAVEQGPFSEAARRYMHLVRLGGSGPHFRTDVRRQRRLGAPPMDEPSDLEKLFELAAAEVLDAPPSDGAPVVQIPEGRDFGKGRVLIRIGLNERQWTGSFARGNRLGITCTPMPDREHLFISADGAGYVIDAKTHALVTEAGRDVVGVLLNKARTLFVVVHDDRVLEAFDATGSLWITRPVSAGGFRNIKYTDHVLMGESQHPLRAGWMPFEVSLATGEARFGP